MVSSSISKFNFSNILKTLKQRLYSIVLKSSYDKNPHITLRTYLSLLFTIKYSIDYKKVLLIIYWLKSEIFSIILAR